MPAIMQLRLHFARFIYKMIISVPGKADSPSYFFLRFLNAEQKSDHRGLDVTYSITEECIILLLRLCLVLSTRKNLRIAPFFVQLIGTLFITFSASLQRNLLPDDMRCNLFFLFSSWCAHFGAKALGHEK